MEESPIRIIVKQLEWHKTWEFGLDLWRSEGYEISQQGGVGPYYVKGNGMHAQSEEKLDDAMYLAQQHHECRVLGWIKVEDERQGSHSPKRKALLSGIQKLINIAEQAEVEERNNG